MLLLGFRLSRCLFAHGFLKILCNFSAQEVDSYGRSSSILPRRSRLRHYSSPR